MEKSLKEIKKDFDAFLVQVPNYIEKLNKLTGKKLTYKYDDIDTVQAFYEKNYEEPEKIGLDIEGLNNMFYAYFGEAFIHYNGGRWDLITRKTDKAYGTPVILDWKFNGNKGIGIRLAVWKNLICKDLMDEQISKIIQGFS